MKRVTQPFNEWITKVCIAQSRLHRVCLLWQKVNIHQTKLYLEEHIYSCLKSFKQPLVLLVVTLQIFELRKSRQTKITAVQKKKSDYIIKQKGYNVNFILLMHNISKNN